MPTEAFVETFKAVALNRLIESSRKSTCFCKSWKPQPTKLPSESKIVWSSAFQNRSKIETCLDEKVRPVTLEKQLLLLQRRITHIQSFWQFCGIKLSENRWKKKMEKLKNLVLKDNCWLIIWQKKSRQLLWMKPNLKKRRIIMFFFWLIALIRFPLKGSNCLAQQSSNFFGKKIFNWYPRRRFAASNKKWYPQKKFKTFALSHFFGPRIFRCLKFYRS